MAGRSPTLSPSTPSTPPGDRKNSWAPPARNPVALRLYKVLGTNFDDEPTREALRTLSELYSAPAAAKGKAVQRDAEEWDDDEGDDDALEKGLAVADDALTLESIPGEAAARARKSLRRDMENRLAAGSRQFLQAFGEVDQVRLPMSQRPCGPYVCVGVWQKLDALQEHVRAMRASCDEAEAQLQLTGDASKTLLERAGSLREERCVSRSAPPHIDDLNVSVAGRKWRQRSQL